ncbi:hypothetical protein VE04_06141 [Pseudogymnoascus sp. 24MN13]|nr:hypothetical protein VE04_06141 [Pseudogymnoascus sp. 24MN13]
MSQDYYKGMGKASDSGESREKEQEDQRGQQPPTASGPPKYVTVGSGSTSENAARLKALLDRQDHDSGYGGSIMGESATGPAPWSPILTEDRPTPSHTPTYHGQSSAASENERRVQAAAIHQLWYNSHRGALARYINNVVETLKELQQFNTKWPAHYPSVQGAETLTRANQTPQPGLTRSQSTFSNPPNRSGSPRPGLMKRAATSLGEPSEAESSSAAEQRTVPEPRLITPQIAQDFSILKLDLKLGALHQVELVHSLEKGSIAALLDGKISSSIKHLLSLRERIEDTSSKVLVTGDLNAGKSTFCNALLRRKILPEDQQPCTSLFCEVLDARENGGIEEVHAIHKDSEYNRHDESTFDVFSLAELERIVLDNETYTQCKVYVKDVRTIDESLLNNGVVDISLIDAPGLNFDTTKTTAVFARQEEIDVVVFVVNAANHFTLTAREFIGAAAAEKAYIFIVVNGYDNIKDKQRCQKLILDQVAGLSPRTHKESSELVHFVSSNAVPTAPLGGPGGGGGGGHDDDDDNSKKDKGKEKEKIQDFEALEQSLRRFVLEKRARSKLAPAKTYLLNMLGDVHALASVNVDVAQAELDRVTKELEELEPILEASQKAKSEVSDDIDQTIEKTCKEIYDHTRSTLVSTISHAAEADLGIQYRGVFGAFDFAEEIKEAILSQISTSVTQCEEHARQQTVQGVNTIKQLGLLHLGDEYTDLSFRSDVMFRRKRDMLAREVHVETEVWDFFDWSTILHRQEKVAGTGMAMTVGPRGAAKLVGNNNLRKLIVPGVLAAVKSPTPAPAASQPRSPPNSRKSTTSTPTPHASPPPCAKSIRFPADDLRVGLQRGVEHLGIKREETLKTRGESDGREGLRSSVEAVDLEGPAPGVAAAYDNL